MAEDQQVYIGQKVILEKNGFVLVLNDHSYGADLPGGKIQIGETDSVKALKREVFEETGLKIVLGKPFYTCFVVFSKKREGKLHKNSEKRIYQVYFFARYISGTLRLSDEHTNYLWVNKNTYQKIFEDKLGNTTKAFRRYFTGK